jgi:hypothetical protein
MVKARILQRRTLRRRIFTAVAVLAIETKPKAMRLLDVSPLSPREAL